jgi:hypothetical protein
VCGGGYPPVPAPEMPLRVTRGRGSADDGGHVFSADQCAIMDDEPDVHETPSRSHQPVVKATVATREYHCAKHGAPHVDPYRSGW